MSRLQIPVLPLSPFPLCPRLTRTSGTTSADLHPCVPARAGVCRHERRCHLCAGRFRLGSRFAPFAIACQRFVRLHDHCVIAHEALMRPATGISPLHLLDRARAQTTLGEPETRAARSAASGYDFAGDGLLPVNPGARAILGGNARPEQVLEVLQAGWQQSAQLRVEIAGCVERREDPRVLPRRCHR